MRFLFACLLLLAPAAGLRAAEAEFLRVWPQWQDTEAFERIGDYFGAPENTGRRIVVRTKPEARAGYYFLVRVKHSTALQSGKFNLHVIHPASPDTRTFSFPIATDPKSESVFQLGITGTDWPDGQKAQPVAWKLDLLGADGRVLATQKSFLWEKPAK